MRVRLLVLVVLSACGIPVETTSGTEVGHTAKGVNEWLGIRYAEPPVGPLRFAPPMLRGKQSGEHWAGSMGGSCENGEDCLFLNVWAPPDAKGLPVMLFIHGGAYTMGSAPEAATLARKGNVVTVTINYRLGVFGFLAHEDIASEPGNVAGNYGLLDQQLALQWVKQNIAAFGGDPGNVTIFGESAGAGSVCSHLLSPRAEGLFHRAIGQSGSCVFDFPSRERMQATGRRVAEALGCTGDTPACLRAASFDALKRAMPAKLEFEADADKWVPTADGDVLPTDTFSALEGGKLHRVPFLSGANGNEGSLFTLAMRIETRAELEELVRKAMPNHADDALALYSEAKFPVPKDAATALIGDVFVCGQRKQAALISAHVPDTYLYHFTRANPSLAWNLGATHGSEVPYVLGDIGFPLTETKEDTKLSEDMIGYWSRFARTGDPNGGGAVTWPRFGAGGEYLVLDVSVEAKANLAPERCDVFEAWLPSL